MFRVHGSSHHASCIRTINFEIKRGVLNIVNWEDSLVFYGLEVAKRPKLLCLSHDVYRHVLSNWMLTTHGRPAN